MPLTILSFIVFLSVCPLLLSISHLLPFSISYVISEKGSGFALDGLGGESDVWAPYVHPFVRLSANSLSQMSLEMCTESLGFETGSDGILFSDDTDDTDDFSFSYTASSDDEEEVLAEKSTQAYDGIKSKVNEEEETVATPQPSRRKKPAAVNYHCSECLPTPECQQSHLLIRHPVPSSSTSSSTVSCHPVPELYCCHPISHLFSSTIRHPELDDVIRY